WRLSLRWQFCPWPCASAAVDRTRGVKIKERASRTGRNMTPQLPVLHAQGQGRDSKTRLAGGQLQSRPLQKRERGFIDAVRLWPHIGVESGPRRPACGVYMSESYPVLPLRDIVVFPHMIVPLFVGRDKSVAALESAMAADKSIFLVSQLDPAEDDPDRDALYDLGVVATVLQLLKLPDGTVRVLVEGKHRATLKILRPEGTHLSAEVDPVETVEPEGVEVKALVRSVIEQFENYAKVNRKLPAETAVQLGQIEEPSKLADAVAPNVNIKVADKQALLAELDPVRRLEMAFAFMEGELGVMQVEKKIRSRVKRQMEKTQREYYLNEQLKAIQRELGNESEEG